MKVVDAIAHILKAEGVEYLFAYPVNPLIEAAARVDIRPIIVRQERIGLHMADAFSRINSGEQIGVFCMQYGPGTENAFGGVAQAYGESAPIIVLPGGYPRAQAQLQPNFSAYLNFQHVTKSCEQVVHGSLVVDAMRRAFAAVRSGRPRPALVEIPNDVWNEEVPEPLAYQPVRAKRSGPDPADVRRAAELLVAAQRPVIYAGQGVHYAKAWPQLRALAELLEAPVTTSLGGKSAFPENHPLALGAGGRAMPQAVHHFVQASDVIFGIGCSFTTTNFGTKLPKTKRYVHATLDAADIDKEIPAEVGLVGDAALTLDALLAELSARLGGKPRGRSAAVAAEIASVREPWLNAWRAKLDSDATPLSPYRVIRDLLRTVDGTNTIITHDAGSPRDQLSPFWVAAEPLSYIGWGKTTQLGYGLGLAMGAKLARPDKLCINVWGDAAIGFTGMDFETTVRERIPIMSVLFNNFSMAIELPIMPVSTEKYRSTDISGRYADMARAFGGYGERVTTPDEIVPAIRRGIAQTQAGVPVLLEFITMKETKISAF
ncbi:MAG: thiamine pyrophosphate-requiring protein [Chloroflexi bacterium]|nr:thiamine pyrophosphate-requiring protein [Chloroflexota bacterium]